MYLFLFCAGQYYDLLHLLELTGEPSETHYLLMNGDLVDRGSWSIEVIITAFAFKCTSYLDPFLLASLPLSDSSTDCSLTCYLYAI